MKSGAETYIVKSTDLCLVLLFKWPCLVSQWSASLEFLEIWCHKYFISGLVELLLPFIYEAFEFEVCVILSLLCFLLALSFYVESVILLEVSG